MILHISHYQHFLSDSVINNMCHYVQDPEGHIDTTVSTYLGGYEVLEFPLALVTYTVPPKHL